MPSQGRELNSANEPIDQLPPIGAVRRPDIIAVETIEDKDYLERLAFAEEPVTIWIEEGQEENAPRTVGPIQCNGTGVEVLIKDQWVQFHHLPVNTQLVVKRKYLALMLGSKRTRITHVQDHAEANFAEMNIMRRQTSAAMSVTILLDENPRGRAWMMELTRRAA
jgi:hypothetical protein